MRSQFSSQKYGILYSQEAATSLCLTNCVIYNKEVLAIQEVEISDPASGAPKEAYICHWWSELAGLSWRQRMHHNSIMPLESKWFGVYNKDKRVCVAISFTMSTRVHKLLMSISFKDLESLPLTKCQWHWWCNRVVYSTWQTQMMHRLPCVEYSEALGYIAVLQNSSSLLFSSSIHS